MSIGWEEVLAVVRGEMVGGELIVTSERNVKTSYGKFRDGQFVFSEAGLEFVRDYKSVGLVAAEEAAVEVAQAVENNSDDEPATLEASEAAAVEIVAQPTLDDLLG